MATGRNGSRRLSNGSGSKMKDANSPAAKSIERVSEGFDFVLLNGAIDEELLASLMTKVSDHLRRAGPARNKKVVLAVVTYGGLPNVAYRIGRYVQTVYDEVTCFVPTVCKSAGTLIITSGHKLILSPFGEIGPLDVQVRQRDELWGRRSGLTTRAALSDLKTHTFETFEHLMLRMIERSGGSISTRLAAEIAARLSADLMAKIYEQVNPEALGQDIRDLSIATEYCKRLNKRSKNLKPDAIERLVHRYPSHDFVIDLEEAHEVFENVAQPTEDLYRLLTTDMVMPRSHGSVVEVLTNHPSSVGDADGDDPKELEPRSDTSSSAGESGDGRGKATPP